MSAKVKTTEVGGRISLRSTEFRTKNRQKLGRAGKPTGRDFYRAFLTPHPTPTNDSNGLNTFSSHVRWMKENLKEHTLLVLGITESGKIVYLGDSDGKLNEKRT
jgi:hypothetical protein